MREHGPTFTQRFKAAFRMVFSGAGGGYGCGGRGYDQWPGTTYAGSTVEYEQLVGTPWHNSAASICLGWIADNLPQARLRVVTNPSVDDDDPKEVKNHALPALIRRPNPFYSGKALFAATAISYCTAGDAYWIKARGADGSGAPGKGAPIQLWYVPHWQILPQFPQDGSQFIASYLYRPQNGKQYTLKRSDLVHFRFGIDPENPRLGWSRLKAVLREMLTDNEIAAYTAALLRNMGMPGAVASPAFPDGFLPPDARAELEATYQAKFTKENRGKLLVSSHPLKIEAPGFSPEQLVIDRMGDRPEARICAALRIPPLVVNLSVGEATRTYANYGEARSAAWEECIIPMHADFAETLDTDLLPDLGNMRAEDVEWDYKKVRALAEDETARSTRATTQFAAGGITRAEYRAAIGQKPAPGDEDEVYFVPRGGQLVPAEHAGAKVLTAQAEMQQQQQAALQGIQDSAGDQGAAPLPAHGGTNGNGRSTVAA